MHNVNIEGEVMRKVQSDKFKNRRCQEMNSVNIEDVLIKIMRKLWDQKTDKVRNDTISLLSNGA